MLVELANQEIRADLILFADAGGEPWNQQTLAARALGYIGNRHIYMRARD
jgi:hypothetical protein